MSENKVFLGGISRDATEEDVSDLVKKFGNPREIIHTGKGYSFVKFDAADEMQPFVDKINGEVLCGMTIRADISKPKERNLIPSEKWNSMTPQERDAVRAQRSGGGGGGGQRGAFIPADQWNAMTPRERDEARAARSGGGGRDADRRRDDRRERSDSCDRRRRDSRSPKRRRDSRDRDRDRDRDSRRDRRRRSPS